MDHPKPKRLRLPWRKPKEPCTICGRVTPNNVPIPLVPARGLFDRYPPKNHIVICSTEHLDQWFHENRHQPPEPPAPTPKWHDIS